MNDKARETRRRDPKPPPGGSASGGERDASDVQLVFCPRCGATVPETAADCPVCLAAIG